MTCPPCDRFHECIWKGRFIVAIEEHLIYRLGHYVKCPMIGRKIYLKSNFFVLSPERHTKVETEISYQSPIKTSRKTKYARKINNNIQTKQRRYNSKK